MSTKFLLDSCWTIQCLLTKVYNIPLDEGGSSMAPSGQNFHTDPNYMYVQHSGFWRKVKISRPLTLKKSQQMLTSDFNKKSVRSVSPSQPDQALRSHKSLVRARGKSQKVRSHKS